VLVAWQRCPACGAKGRFGKHAVYQKYHFAERIDIQRVRCHDCGTTHAMIPCFSVPDTSMGTEEAEGCLAARAQGASRSKAGSALMERGMDGRSGRHLEKMLDTAVARAKAIWPEAAAASLHGLGWIAAVCGRADHPILELNRWALDHGVNAICFCRASILFFHAAEAAGARSLDPASAAGPAGVVTVVIASNANGGPP
jgi:hypothetical protein